MSIVEQITVYIQEITLVSLQQQLMLKKNHVNEPERSRIMLSLPLFLRGHNTGMQPCHKLYCKVPKGK